MRGGKASKANLCVVVRRNVKSQGRVICPRRMVVADNNGLEISGFPFGSRELAVAMGKMVFFQKRTVCLGTHSSERKRKRKTCTIRPREASAYSFFPNALLFNVLTLVNSRCNAR